MHDRVREFAANSAVSDRLTIVIPALNEEEAIGDTISRCLAASDRIKQFAALSDVEVIVVSDGSSDQTAQIARSFDNVRVIEFSVNQGYGAAIKEGWRQGTGNLVGFLDADGTCDPNYFAEMCQIAKSELADVVLGSRLGPDSKMPPIRRLGNRIYAALLGLLCGRHITDTASGMRVVRRESLKYLYPLPDGLHFTPSMSARALLNDLRVIEIPMPYEDRVGESKLSVFRDGIRFFRTIFDSVLCYRPERILIGAFAGCFVLGVLLGIYPTEFYLRNRRLEEWMIYRFVACYLLGSFGLTLLMATALVSRISHFGPRRTSAAGFWSSAVAAFLRGRMLTSIVIAGMVIAIAFLWPGIQEFATTGHISMHWSRLLAGAFSLFFSFQAALFGLLMAVTSLWTAQKKSGLGAIATRESAPSSAAIVNAEDQQQLMASELTR